MGEGNQTETFMDIVFIGLTVALVGLTFGLIRLCHVV
jgi:hypothetical protein